MRQLFHLHWDLRWRQEGIWYKFECRCGARRLRAATRNQWGPVPEGWPQMADRHGRAVMDSGWVR